MSIYEERLARIKAAIALEKTDKIPVISGATAFCAPATGTKLSDFINDMELNCTCGIKTTELMGNIDGIQTPLSSPEGLPALWLSNISIPGRDLPDDELWQVVENELMSQEDYDLILSEGFGHWYGNFVKEKLGDPLNRMKPLIEYGPVAARRWKDAGYPIIKNGTLSTPFEMLCGGRSLVTFLTDDLLEIPETLDAVFDEVHRYNMEKYENSFRSDNKPFGVWVGGWRGTPEMLSPAMFQRFSWKYYRELVQLCIDYGVTPVMHLDSCWDNGLHYFNEFPAGKCVMALDGKTDIFKAKEIVGDRICIMGDVPAQLLAFGSADDVYDYTMKLIRNVGPTGLMLCSGCDIPLNAKMENVQMISKAADDAAGI